MRVYLPKKETKTLPAFIMENEIVTFQKTGELLEHLRRHNGSEPCILVICDTEQKEAAVHIRFCFPEVTTIPIIDLMYTFIRMRILVARITPMFSVRTDHVMYIESRNRKLYFHFPDYCRTINHPVKSLPDMTCFGIIRCHTSYLINLEYAETIGEWEIQLAAGETIPISRKYSPKLKKYRKKQHK